MKSRLLSLTVILGALTAFAPMTTDMYLPSLPTLARVFGVQLGAVQLTLAVFFFGLVCGQLVYGPLTDRYGRKRPLYIGVSLYVLVSIGCALAPNLQALIGLRFVQGFTGCVGMVVARAVVRDLFDAQESARMYSLIMLVMGLAPIVAPLAGGYLLVAFGWQSIFYALAAFGVFCLVGSVAWLPETRHAAARTSAGFVTVIGGYGRLLSDRHFIGFALSGSLASAGMFAYIAGSPGVFIDLHHVPAQYYGWLFGSNALGMIVASQLNRRLLRQVAAGRVLMRANLFNAGMGLLLGGLVATGTGGFAGILLPLFLYVASLGFIMPNSNALALAYQGARAGSASGLLGTLHFSMAALAALAVGALYDGTALPMAGVIATCGVAALAAHRWIAPRGAVLPGAVAGVAADPAKVTSPRRSG